MVGVAGTITTVAAGCSACRYDRAAIDQAVLALEDVHATTASLLAMTVAELGRRGTYTPAART